MRLAILLYSMSGGGAERVVSYLVSYFNTEQITIHLILMNETIKYDLPPNINIHFLEKSDFNESGLLKLVKVPKLAYKYSCLLNELEITHSFSLLSRPNYINILSKFFGNHSSRTIISERAYPSLQYGYKGLKSGINKYLIKYFYPKADAIICNSSGNKQDLIVNFKVPEDSITVINNPVDIKKISKIEPIEGFFDENSINLISVGRLDKGKNHKLLIEAVSKVPNIKLYILGEGPLKDELLNLIDSKGLQRKVYILGFIDNPYKYLKAADLFVFGSNHEGFPNVLLEAMACGLPLITTNCKSGPSEILDLKVEDSEDIMITNCGILVPVQNVSLMEKAIVHFLNNKTYEEKCRRNAMKRIKNYEMTYILDKYKKAILNG